MSYVLLLESDKILAENLMAVLKLRGHKVDWQLEPQTAVDSADKKKPDVVILDLVLSARSGIEFLNEFRSYPEWQHLPVIIYSEIPAEEFALSGGFNQLEIMAYHHKPTSSMRQILDSVETAAAAVTL